MARGGKALPNNGETPVWEPFLYMVQGKLIHYYSDQRDPKHGQKLVHEATSDLRSWGPVVDDVTNSDYSARPGMTTIAKLPNGQYIITYEECSVAAGGCPVYYRLSPDPLAFNSATRFPLKSSDGNQSSSSPYVVWTPVGGPKGTVVASTGGDSEIYLHKDLANPSVPWQKVKTNAPAAYSRSLRVMDDPKQILVVGGGVLNGMNNTVTSTIFEIPA